MLTALIIWSTTTILGTALFGLPALHHFDRLCSR